jgi:hypothetical protein
VNVMSKWFRADKAKMVRTLGARFGIYLLIALGVLFSASTAHASDIYVAQNSAGASNGTDCANARAMSSLAAGDWSAGNTIHLCGTLTDTLTAQGSGSAGNAVTVKFEPGAKFSLPALSASGQLVLSNKSYITVDGGGGTCGYVNNVNVTCNGGSTNFESTANCTSCANHVNSIAIIVDGSDHVEIKSLFIGPIYVHDGSGDDTLTQRTFCVHGYSFPTNLSIHNNTMHDMGWCLDGGGPGLVYDNNEVYHVDHGLGTGGPITGNINVEHNHFHDFANWDTSSDTYHHDGIHLFTDGGAITGRILENGNLFDGDFGNNVTSWIYDEGDVGTITGVIEINNVAYSAAGRNSCCGYLDLFKNEADGIMVNNTVYGPGVTPGTGSAIEVCEGTETNIRIQNNALATAQNIIGICSGATLTALSNNAYFNSAGSDSFSWHNALFGSFATWVADSGETNSVYDSLANFKLDANGKPQTGSVLIGAGANLTSLGIPELNKDILGNPRPASGAWDIGAFQYTQGSQVSQPAPPTNLRATAQ